ncbi:F-box/LRR-repeat protein At1g06630 [Oryza sativa Japonica Group]|uniref:Os02g0178200 protein n=2 Tax=Oryza sativa subsp. japonica TaxID=39947 RepID=A0A0P0VFJ1_ORYSJ|nr:F-box/LRR-repeat protein At1g06630 [Oryza sativa Japonica Group]KAB8086124.1 hypothetical protein EE612_009238 [Oryza sativa]KAF2943412.1 hypothetical protein DAI22_02g061500 [Oryza sativa Japonica Group]BAS77277.1 Os02g0178200 [Oryza sativa Japonica Group]
MSLPRLAAFYWPRLRAADRDDVRAAGMGHGLDPEGITITPLMDMVLGFLYQSIPRPPVSASASLSAAAATGDGGGDDRISLLPDDILRAVVSRLPAKDGARTAVLSSRWRRLWRSTPLVLVDTHLLPRRGGGRPARAGAASRAVADAVSRVLEAHPGPFPFVSLSCSFIGDDAQRGVAARWLDLLAAKGVEHLVFVNRPCPLPGVTLPAALFNCSSLRRLYIGSWELPDTASIPLPRAAAAAAFPNLRELVLGCVVMVDGDLPFLLAASPALETLAVFGILNTLRARLSSGSLRCAQFCLSFMEEVAVLDAPHLERLFLWRNIKNTRVKIGHAPQLRMLGYLQPGVHQLEIGNTIIKARTIVRPGTTVPSVNMLALHLHFGVRNEVKMLPSFLRCFPNVETLCIESEEAPGRTSNIDVNFWQEAGPIECVQSHLKMMILREFQGEESELSFLKFVGENARVLEKMVIVMKLGRYSAPEEVAAKVMDLQSAKWAREGNKLGFLISRLRAGGSAWSLRDGTDLSCDDPFMCL